jgi:PAS domain S-box-containing protein
VNQEGTIVDCNKVQAEKLGYLKDELIGKSGFDLIAECDRDYALKEFQKLQEQNRVENIELWGLTKHGKYRALSTTSKITLPDNTVQYLIVTKDITDSYNQQNKINELRENFSDLGEITSKIAHDLRNPLTVIKLQLELIKKDSVTDEKSKDRLSIVENLLSEITSTISDIVNYIRIGKNNKQNVSAKELLEITLQGLVIPTTISFEGITNNLSVLCDKTKMSIVLRNLISNSIDSINGGGTIKMEFSEDPLISVIKVIDSGNGIPDNISKNIFDSLFTTKPNGTGLGLAICKNIVTSHGGSISVQNNPTTFVITLPKH